MEIFQYVILKNGGTAKTFCSAWSSSGVLRKFCDMVILKGHTDPQAASKTPTVVGDLIDCHILCCLQAIASVLHGRLFAIMNIDAVKYTLTSINILYHKLRNCKEFRIFHGVYLITSCGCAPGWSKFFHDNFDCACENGRRMRRFRRSIQPNPAYLPPLTLAGLGWSGCATVKLRKCHFRVVSIIRPWFGLVILARTVLLGQFSKHTT
jgi:hypothetical protein